MESSGLSFRVLYENSESIHGTLDSIGYTKEKVCFLYMNKDNIFIYIFSNNIDNIFET
jgi:hypothetical protein